MKQLMERLGPMIFLQFRLHWALQPCGSRYRLNIDIARDARCKLLTGAVARAF